MSLKEKMDKLKRVLSGQEDDDEQNIVAQASENRPERKNNCSRPMTCHVSANGKMRACSLGLVGLGIRLD